jgi:hypothetical protein
MHPLRERLAQFEEFNRWEEHHPVPARDLTAVLADLSFLLSLVSPETRATDPDPEKHGIQETRVMLARVAEHIAKQREANERQRT